MVKRFGINFITAALAAAPCGCMTGLNTLYYAPMEGGKTVYGGVKLDAECIGKSFGKADPGWDPGPLKRICTAILCTVDLPFSAVADTLTLPITIPASIDRNVAEFYRNEHTDAAEWKREWFPTAAKPPAAPPTVQASRPAP